VRNISFLLTTSQVLNQSKTVTRRLGWTNLQPGTQLQACRKCMGLRKGEQVEKLTVITVTDVRREPLRRLIDDPSYGRAEATAEGFPDLDGPGFVAMFCQHMRVSPDDEVTRIEFAYSPTSG